jgi:hypothetical protein
MDVDNVKRRRLLRQEPVRSSQRRKFGSCTGHERVGEWYFQLGNSVVASCNVTR